MNVYTPERYDERIFHLALGIEPRSSLSQQRLPSSVDVRLEDFPSPVTTWRIWRPGETLTSVLPRLDRHRSGRFTRRYDERIPTAARLRIVDDRVNGAVRMAGQGQRIVPRRLEMAVVDNATVLAAEADPNTNPIPVWQRSYPIACFPGSAADIGSRATAVRGRVMRPDPGTGDLVPARWARVRALNNDGEEVGWAHGDDRGEFLLVIEPTAADIAIPADPTEVHLTVGSLAPIAPAEPLLPVIDPLWDLPVEAVTASPTPQTEPSITGRAFLPEHAVAAPVSPAQPIAVPHGGEPSIDIAIA